MSPRSSVEMGARAALAGGFEVLLGTKPLEATGAVCAVKQKAPTETKINARQSVEKLRAATIFPLYQLVYTF